ncbi:MAG: hypothetical protein ACRDJC_00735 [Thermomicrobiales bacterium]
MAVSLPEPHTASTEGNPMSTTSETHEPAEPNDWPDGHVSVTIARPAGADARRLTTAEIDLVLTDQMPTSAS